MATGADPLGRANPDCGRGREPALFCVPGHTGYGHLFWNVKVAADSTNIDDDNIKEEIKENGMIKAIIVDVAMVKMTECVF